jgi:hypothetical protein
MDTVTASVAYSTSTSGEVNYEGLNEELSYELELYPADPHADDYWVGGYDDGWDSAYCFVCHRSTDHRGEHDDLVAEGLASYGKFENASVYSYMVSS